MRTTIRTPWTRQPQVPTEIDWRNPITQGLGSLVIAHPSFKVGDFVKKTSATLVGDYPISFLGRGVGSFSAPSANGIYFGRNDAASASWRPTTGPLTLVCVVTAGSAVSSAYIGGACGNSINGYFFYTTNGDGTVNAGAFLTSAKTISSPSGTWSAGKKLILILVLDGTNLLFYINGVLQGSVAASGTITYDTSFGRVQLIGSSDLTGSAGIGHWMGRWDRAFSPSEVAVLSSNPWQLFAPLSRTLWVPVAAGGGTIYTMSPSGAITFNGSSKQLRTRLQVPSGNITFSETVPLLRTRLQTTSGSIVFSGTAPFSQQNTYTLSPGGTITFSGSGNQIRERIQIPTGSITFSGTNVTQHIRTLVPTGSIDFSGSATETRIRIIAPTGQITFLGSAPLINPNAVGGVSTWRTLTGMGN